MGRLSGNSSLQASGSGAVAPSGAGPSPALCPTRLLLALCERCPTAPLPCWGSLLASGFGKFPFSHVRSPPLLNREVGGFLELSLWAALPSLVQPATSLLQQPFGLCGVTRCRVGRWQVPVYILLSLMSGALKTIVLCVFGCFRGGKFSSCYSVL